MADIYTSAGEAKIIDLMDAATWYAAWGTGAGTAVKGSTILFTEASEARVATTDSQPVADKLRMIATITADAAKTITNAGVFDAAAGGNLLQHHDFAGIALGLNDRIEFTFEHEQT